MSAFATQKIEYGRVHNMSRLHDYAVFKKHSPECRAYLTAPGLIEIYWQSAEPPKSTQLVLKKVDYIHTDCPETPFTLTKVAALSYRYSENKIIVKEAPVQEACNYIVEVDGFSSFLYLSPEIGGILDTVYDATAVHDLGLTYDGREAVIKVWSPPAGKMDILLFDQDQKCIKIKSFEYTAKGVWKIVLNPEDATPYKTLDGLYYQLGVYAYGEVRYALDPYAPSMAAFAPTDKDNIGKAAIIDINGEKARPQSFLKTYNNTSHMDNEADMIAYELHVRDFTIQPGTLSKAIAGTYRGFQEKIDYLKKLGITHVQLMPVQKFYTVNERDRSFSDGNKEAVNYNWGYDPHHFFTLSGWLSTNAECPYIRIKEFRSMVQSLHHNGLGVIMDVVFNHTYVVETFENVAPGCYYRYSTDAKISGKNGAGPSLESRRKMMRKLIIDALVFFVKEYHIDGFRFDLMSFLDHFTMQEIRNIVGKAYDANNKNALILYGEGWLFSDIDKNKSATGEQAATTKINFPSKDFNIAFFNDTARDGITGYKNNKGFVQGAFHTYDRLATVIVGGLKNFAAGKNSLQSEAFNSDYNRFAYQPTDCLNFLTVHDGFTLWDKINLTIKDPTKEKRARIMRLAAAILFTSQGKIVWHGGDEIMRTKPLAKMDKEQNRAHTSGLIDKEEGITQFHENSYSSCDFTNMFRWDRLCNNYEPYAKPMQAYFKALVQMRRKLKGLRYEHRESVRKGLTFLTEEFSAFTDTHLHDFNDKRLTALELIFINGPANEKYYIAGELYPQDTPANDKNLKMHHLSFDAQGNASIRFDRSQIEKFDPRKWGHPDVLIIKLVKEPGSWHTPYGTYSPLGNNIIHPGAVNNKQQVIIDLSVPDYEATFTPFEPPSYLAYHINNTLEGPALFDELFVVHNASEKSLELKAPFLKEPSKWHVIVDSHNAGIEPLTYADIPDIKKGETHVCVSKNMVRVPYLSSAVLGKKN